MAKQLELYPVTHDPATLRNTFIPFTPKTSFTVQVLGALSGTPYRLYIADISADDTSTTAWSKFGETFSNADQVRNFNGSPGFKYMLGQDAARLTAVPRSGAGSITAYWDEVTTLQSVYHS